MVLLDFAPEPSGDGKMSRGRVMKNLGMGFSEQELGEAEGFTPKNAEELWGLAQLSLS